MRRFKELIKKCKQFYQKTFDPTEDEINFESFSKFPLFFLKLFFYDFQQLSEHANMRMKVKHNTKRIFNRFCLMSLVVGTIQTVNYSFTHSDDFNTIIHAISEICSFLAILIKGLILILRKDKILEIFEELKTLFENRLNGIEDCKIKKYLAGYSQLIKIYVGIFLIENLIMALPWLPYLISGSKISVVNFWFPFDIFAIKQLWIDWLSHIYVTFLLALDAMIYAFITIISIEFDFLKNNLKFIKVESKDERRLKVASLINRLNTLNTELGDKLQKLLEPFFLYIFVISSITICTGLFKLLISDTELEELIFNSLSLTINMCQTCVLCYYSYGQKLMDSSVGVADEIYGCDWTDLDDNEFKKQMITVIIRAQKPMRLTAMGFADISLETFTTVKYFCRI